MTIKAVASAIRSLANFIERAMDRILPFYVIFTDNHMAFTMKYTQHPQRKTVFTKKAEAKQIAHALIEVTEKI